MARRERQALHPRFETPLTLVDHETYYAITDNRGKVVAQGSYELMTTTHPKVLPPAFPSGPKRPGKHELQFVRGTKILNLHLFAATYSAKKFLDAVLGKHKYTWLDHTTVEVDDLDLTIKCPELETVFEHEYSAMEKEWHLPEPYSDYALKLAGEKKASKTKLDKVVEALPKVFPKKKGAPPQREVPKGMITLAAICTELGIDPRVGRSYLRKEHTKPDEGWMWDAKGTEAIKKDLKKGVKK